MGFGCHQPSLQVTGGAKWVSTKVCGASRPTASSVPLVVPACLVRAVGWPLLQDSDSKQSKGEIWIFPSRAVSWHQHCHLPCQGAHSSAVGLWLLSRGSSQKSPELCSPGVGLGLHCLHLDPLSVVLCSPPAAAFISECRRWECLTLCATSSAPQHSSGWRSAMR